MKGTIENLKKSVKNKINITPKQSLGANIDGVGLGGNLHII